MKTSARSVAWERIAPPATLLLVSLLAAAPLWGPGLLNTRGGGDSPFLLVRTHQLAANLRAGVFPARWMPDAAYGLGYPFFSYYAALPYYLAAGLSLTGVGILTALKLTQTLFMAAAALAMYAWASRVLQRRSSAWLASVAYTVAPFHLVNVYFRGDSLSEFAAFTFFPLILWGLDRLAAAPSVKRSLLPGVAYAALILTHNVSALIFSPFLLAYALFYIGGAVIPARRRSWHTALSRSALLFLPVLLGLLLSAWFWLPALGETHYVQLDAQTTGYFFYGNHFRASDLVQQGFFFDYDAEGLSASPFSMGLVQAMLIVLGILTTVFASLRRRRSSRTAKVGKAGPRSPFPDKERTALLLAAAACLIATGMITPLSSPLWEGVPLLPMVQFPWRFLSLQALFGALLTGAVVRGIEVLRPRAAWAGALFLAALLIAGSLVGLNPEFLPIGEADVTTERLRLYELFTGNIGSTIRYEYLPRWVEPRPRAGPQDVTPTSAARATPVDGTLLRAERRLREPTRRTWHLRTATEGASVAFPLLHWPGWRATIDGVEVPVAPAPSSGYLTVQVPPGEHTVELRLGRTPLRAWAEALSAAALVAVLALWLRAQVQQVKGRSAPSSRQRRSHGRPAQSGGTAVLASVPFLVLLALIAAFQPRAPAAAADDLTMDFEWMPYLHHNPDGAARGGWLLTRYAYRISGGPAGDTVSAGDTLEVTLHWRLDPAHEQDGGREGGSFQGDLSLVPPAAVRHPSLPPLAQARFQVGGNSGATKGLGSTTVTLEVPDQASPGIHLIQMAGTPPLYLHPVWVIDGPSALDAPSESTFADGALRLHDVRVTQPSPERLEVALDWSAARPTAANYGLSLSLTDPAGNEWLVQGTKPGYDTQPGLGFLPTSLWPIDRHFQDQHAPALAAGAPPGDAYCLTVDLYDVTTWQSVGEYTETVGVTEVSSRPSARVLGRFGGELELSRLDLPSTVRQGETLRATAFWAALAPPTEEYTAAWRLIGEDRTISATLPLAPGSSPREWPAGAWVAGRASLAIPPTTPPGRYTATITLLAGEDGTPIGDHVHSVPVDVVGRERVWTLPPLEQSVEAEFGGMIELAGYDLKRVEGRLAITLHWRALAVPDRHYTFFVHLADPQTGRPASQVDGMPRGFTYPTGQWAPGEVVSDQVELSTEGVPSGRYVLAVGWYDPDTKLRLPAVDREGTPVTDDRVILQDTVTVP